MHFLLFLSLFSLVTLPGCDWFSKKDKIENCGCNSHAAPEECAQQCDAQNADQFSDTNEMADPMVDGARLDGEEVMPADKQ